MVNPPYIDNPAKAQYLYGETFYHVIKSCPTTGSDLYFLPSDRKCYSSCPVLGYALDLGSKTCLACHFTCKSCTVGFLVDKCSACDSDYRVFDSSTNKCVCPTNKYDDGVSLSCPSCHSTCLTCVSSTQASCKSCDGSLKREFYDPNSDGIGECKCITTYYENTANSTCDLCSNGCLTCTVVSST